MKLKHLQSHLSQIPNPTFPSPTLHLEQYPTSPTLTSHIIHTALVDRNDLGPHLSVCDLGCGTGMLGIGAAIVGCRMVLCVDCDGGAMEVCRGNFRGLGLEEGEGDGEGGCKVEYVVGRVRHRVRMGDGGSRGGRGGRGRGRGRGRGGTDRRRKTSRSQRQIDQELSTHHSSPTTNNNNNDNENDDDDDGIPLRSNCVDTVLTNPPFGTKQNAGIDISFLRTAVRLARRAVYSFHKSSTRDYLIRTVEGWRREEEGEGGGGGGYTVEVVAQMKFEIPKMYRFHREESVDVDVDLIRIGLV